MGQRRQHPGLPCSPRSPTFGSSRRKTPVESGSENLSFPVSPHGLPNLGLGFAQSCWLSGTGNRCLAWLGAGGTVSGDPVPDPRVRRLDAEPGDTASRDPASASGVWSVLPWRLSPYLCHLGALPARPLCLLILRRRKSAGGTWFSRRKGGGPFYARGGFGHLQGTVLRPSVSYTLMGGGCTVGLGKEWKILAKESVLCFYSVWTVGGHTGPELWEVAITGVTAM